MAKKRASSSEVGEKSISKKYASEIGRSAQLNHEFLEIVGDKIAKREGYAMARGVEAVHLFLCNKHHWTPSQVRGMAPDDLVFLVADEERA